MLRHRAPGVGRRRAWSVRSTGRPTLVGRGVAFERAGVTDATPRSSSDTKRLYAWWLLPTAVVALLLLNIAATAHPSSATVAGAECAGLAAGTAYELRAERRRRM